jgi:flagellar protein FlgJ
MSAISSQSNMGFSSQNAMAQLNSQNYNDLSALQSLKTEGSQVARLKAVSQQFESMFVSMLLKGMRDANKVFSEGNPLQSSQGEFYQQMFDSQLAVSMSSSKGIGIASVVQRQLAPHYGLDPDTMQPLEKSKENIEAYALDDYQRRVFPSSSSQTYSPEVMREVAEVVEKKVIAYEQATNASTGFEQQMIADSESKAVYDFSSPEAFIESLLPYAKQVEAKTGIDARLMLAQSALETGWGQHQILRDNGEPSYNLFGIKAQGSWSGERAEITTTEFRQGVAMKERAEFRAYGSYAESFEDYAHFLQNNERYSDALAQRDDPKAFAHALQSSGYATDPAYGSKIGRILDTYMLGMNDAQTWSEE